MHQPRLFDENEADPVGARAARDDGIGRADAGADTRWKADARSAIRYCAVAFPDGFTADHVLRRLAATSTATTSNLAALGPVFLAAASAGEICKTGYMWPSTIRRRHRELTVWRAT